MGNIEVADLCNYIRETYCKDCIDQGRDLKGFYCIGCYHGTTLQDVFVADGMPKEAAKRMVRVVTHDDR